MFTDFATVAVVLTLLWAGLMAYYLYISRQQKELQEEIDSLRTLLENDDTVQETDG